MIIPAILCIDVEPNARQVSRPDPGPWSGYEAAQAYFTEFRDRARAVTGTAVRLSWFLRMDPQISESYGTSTYVVDRYGTHIEGLLAKGDEIGLHPHPYRWLSESGDWLQDFADNGWVAHCLAVSMEAFRHGLGRPCRSVRWGDRWTNTAAVNLADRLGIRHDLTVEPGAPAESLPSWEKASALLPDYRRVPRRPWVPHPDDFRRPARRPRGLRMVPLTAGHRRLGLRPGGHLRRAVANGLRHRLQDTPLSLWRSWEAPDTFPAMLDRALRVQRRPYLALAVRTDLDFRAADTCLGALLAHPVASRLRFATPAEALAVLGVR